MFWDFDFHPSTGRLVVERREVESSVVVHDLASGERVGGVAGRLLARGPRFSPDAEQVPAPGTAASIGIVSLTP